MGDAAKGIADMCHEKKASGEMVVDSRAICPYEVADRDSMKQAGMDGVD